MADLTDDDAEGTTLVQPDLLKSYARFVARAVRERKLMVFLIASSLAGISLAVLSLLPRIYYTESRLIVQDPGALSEDRIDAFGGAQATLLRQSTLEAIVIKTGLVKAWSESRPLSQRLKSSLLDRFQSSVPSEADKVQTLVGMLGAAYNITGGDGSLTIAVEWTNPQLAARLVEAAQQSFLESRHASQVASLGEYIAILEGYSSKQRTEVVLMAERIQKLREEKVARAKAAALESVKPDPSASAAASRPRVAARPRPKPTTTTDTDTTELKQQLDAKTSALAELERDRAGRLASLRSRLRELLLQYTEAHPDVIRTNQSIESLASDSPQQVTLKGQIDDLKTQIRDRAELAARVLGEPVAGARGPAGAPSPSGLATLPPQVLTVVSTGIDDLDPTIGTEFQYAISKYSSLQSEIDAKRLALDKAQAAFEHRYKIVAPVAVPGAPIKPKVKILAPALVGGSLLFALLIAIVGQLRTGRMIERWQVYMLRLPVLAELHLPPGQKSDR